MTAIGNVNTNTTTFKFGTAAAQFDGTTDAIKFPSDDFAVGSGDFTVEFWCRLNSIVGTGRLFVLGGSADLFVEAPDTFQIVASAANIVVYAKSGTVAAWDVLNGMSITAANTATAWHHVAVTRQSGTFRTFFDGVLTTSTYSALAIATPTLPCTIGALTNLTSAMTGFIDDMRITKGVARYTATFTAPTAAFPDEGPGACIALTAPAALMSAGNPLNIANLTVPAPTLASGGGATVALTAPSPMVRATAHISTEGAALTAPAPALEAWGGANAKLTAPTPTLSSTATGVIWGTADISAPSPEVSAQGVGATMGHAALTAPGPNASAYSGAVVSITIGAPTVSATGTAGAVGHAAVTVPMFQLSASGTEQNHGSANLVVPMPRMAASIQAYMTAPMATLTAIGTATITATYEAYALNLNHNSDASDEMTRYTNFPFTHVVRYKNSYYGANSTGLYLLEGTTDDGVAIDWSFKTGMTDFDSPQNKTVTYAYFGGRLGPAATVSIYPSEPAGTSYAYTTPRGQTAQNYRQQFGKGLKARYFAIGAAGSDTLELDSIDLSVVTLKRRI